MRAATYIACITILLLTTSSCNQPSPPPVADTGIHAFIVGGGSSHDFDRWFNEEDAATLNAAGISTSYTEDVKAIPDELAESDVLVLTTNQPIPDSLTRQAIFDHVDAEKGMLLIHAALWYNWADWQIYNQQLGNGGSKSHGPYGPFEVTLINSDHPVVQGMPASFTVEDELYRFEVDPEGPGIEVLAIGTEPDTGVEFPVIWVVNHPTRRIVSTTLGHDGFTHQSTPYKTLLVNSIHFLME